MEEERRRYYSRGRGISSKHPHHHLNRHQYDHADYSPSYYHDDMSLMTQPSIASSSHYYHYQKKHQPHHYNYQHPYGSNSSNNYNSTYSHSINRSMTPTRAFFVDLTDYNWNHKDGNDYASAIHVSSSQEEDDEDESATHYNAIHNGYRTTTTASNYQYSPAPNDRMSRLRSNQDLTSAYDDDAGFIDLTQVTSVFDEASANDSTSSTSSENDSSDDSRQRDWDLLQNRRRKTHDSSSMMMMRNWEIRSLQSRGKYSSGSSHGANNKNKSRRRPKKSTSKKTKKHHDLASYSPRSLPGYATHSNVVAHDQEPFSPLSLPGLSTASTQAPPLPPHTNSHKPVSPYGLTEEQPINLVMPSLTQEEHDTDEPSNKKTDNETTPKDRPLALDVMDVAPVVSTQYLTQQLQKTVAYQHQAQKISKYAQDPTTAATHDPPATTATSRDREPQEPPLADPPSVNCLVHAPSWKPSGTEDITMDVTPIVIVDTEHEEVNDSDDDNASKAGTDPSPTVDLSQQSPNPRRSILRPSHSHTDLNQAATGKQRDCPAFIMRQSSDPAPPPSPSLLIKTTRSTPNGEESKFDQPLPVDTTNSSTVCVKDTISPAAVPDQVHVENGIELAASSASSSVHGRETRDEMTNTDRKHKPAATTSTNTAEVPLHRYWMPRTSNMEAVMRDLTSDPANAIAKEGSLNLVDSGEASAAESLLSHLLEDSIHDLSVTATDCVLTSSTAVINLEDVQHESNVEGSQDDLSVDAKSMESSNPQPHEQVQETTMEQEVIDVEALEVVSDEQSIAVVEDEQEITEGTTSPAKDPGTEQPEAPIIDAEVAFMDAVVTPKQTSSGPLARSDTLDSDDVYCDDGNSKAASTTEPVENEPLEQTDDKPKKGGEAIKKEGNIEQAISNDLDEEEVWQDSAFSGHDSTTDTEATYAAFCFSDEDSTSHPKKEASTGSDFDIEKPDSFTTDAEATYAAFCFSEDSSDHAESIPHVHDETEMEAVKEGSTTATTTTVAAPNLSNSTKTADLQESCAENASAESPKQDTSDGEHTRIHESDKSSNGHMGQEEAISKAAASTNSKKVQFKDNLVEVAIIEAVADNSATEAAVNSVADVWNSKMVEMAGLEASYLDGSRKSNRSMTQKAAAGVQESLPWINQDKEPQADDSSDESHQTGNEHPEVATENQVKVETHSSLMFGFKDFVVSKALSLATIAKVEEKKDDAHDNLTQQAAEPLKQQYAELAKAAAAEGARRSSISAFDDVAERPNDCVDAKCSDLDLPQDLFQEIPEVRRISLEVTELVMQEQDKLQAQKDRLGSFLKKRAAESKEPGEVVSTTDLISQEHADNSKTETEEVASNSCTSFIGEVKSSAIQPEQGAQLSISVEEQKINHSLQEDNSSVPTYFDDIHEVTHTNEPHGNTSCKSVVAQASTIAYALETPCEIIEAESEIIKDENVEDDNLHQEEDDLIELTVDNESKASTVSALNEDPEDSPGATLDMERLQVLVTSLMTHKHGFEFSTPIDLSKFPDYKENSKYRPIDLGTILRNLINGEYNTILDFQADVNMAFNFRMKHSEKGSKVYKAAKSLKKKFEKDLLKLLDELENELKSATVTGR